MASFSQNLRNSNIFRVPRYIEEEEDYIRPREPMAPPVSQIRQAPLEMPRLRRAEEPMNVVFQKPESESIREANWAERLSPTPLTELQRRTLDLQGKQIEATAGFKERQLDINQQKADIQTFKATNPNARIIAPRGGKVQAINPITGQVIAEFGPTGTMDERERLALEQTQAIELEGERQAGRESIEGMRQTGRETIADIEARHRRELEEFKVGSKPTTELEKGRAFQNKYNILINQRPELRKFVKLDADGVPVITAPATGRFQIGNRPTKDQYDEINSFIFGDTKPPVTPKIETSEGAIPQGEGALPVTPANDPQQRAIAWLKENGVLIPNQAQIAEAIRDLGLK